MALWGGRFESGPDAFFRALNDSLRFDYRLAKHDIAGSTAWARAIARAGVLSAEELTRLEKALGELAGLVEREPEAPLGAVLGHGSESRATQDEDIHSWVERQLIIRVGDLGKKLHTGRSRNDQVATDLRLWTREAIDDRLAELLACRRSLVALAEREIGTVLPGYTHLQRAQPVLLAHWCLAYIEMLERDEGRLHDARRRVNVCPLGSGALAGTAYAIDRAALARDLGFDTPSRNSLDAVSDRDFVIETLAACALTAAHLSRLGEDLILYGSQEFGFIEFDDAVSSGSSLMPQKKNPDAAELLRGKTGRVVGALVSMLTTLKGLPLAYNKDLQEDKEPLFDAMDHLSLGLRVVPRILDTLKVRREVCARAAAGGYTNATDLADYLVAKGVPFRTAHEQVGAAVRAALANQTPLENLTLAELRAHCPRAEQDVFAAIALTAGLTRRELPGGTGPSSVTRALVAAQTRLSAHSLP
ncbi:MAG: argininosuccinate lyase [Phycisphaerae bacterium]|nr:MAG: argininosuccinate lyase [Phycisphaerae bacterium]